MTYEYNNNLPFMKPHDRTIFILQHFGIRLTEEETIAILASGGNNDDYKFGDPPLSFATYAALRIVGFKDENKE
jgi:hypothetical protein